jgi:hypothetical protein
MGRLKRLLPVRYIGLKLIMPVSKNRMFSRTKTAPEKMIAGNIYFSSAKKLPGLFNAINRAAPATTNNIIIYQKC